ncbi:hypothetical protein G6F62_015460 [Rhizopus arrhizus]|nr:hypothetical protein G6F62_015460 [Rhizopus arrhizus]
MSAPPAVDSVTGIPLMLMTNAPTKAPIVMASEPNATSVTLVGRSTYPTSLAVALISCVRPTTVMTSPRYSLDFGRTGMDVSVGPRRMCFRNTPRAPGQRESSSRVLPSTFLFDT